MGGHPREDGVCIWDVEQSEDGLGGGKTWGVKKRLNKNFKKEKSESLFAGEWVSYHRASYSSLIHFIFE